MLKSPAPSAPPAYQPQPAAVASRVMPSAPVQPTRLPPSAPIRTGTDDSSAASSPCAAQYPTASCSTGASSASVRAGTPPGPMPSAANCAGWSGGVFFQLPATNWSLVRPNRNTRSTPGSYWRLPLVSSENSAVPGALKPAEPSR